MITINGTTVTGVTLNGASVNTVTCNGITVFSAMQDYTFPNSSKRCTSNTATYGISFSTTGTWAGYPAWKTMDNDASTYWADFNSPDVITITMPFGIQLNSVTIKNRTGKNAGMTWGTVSVTTSTADSGWQQIAIFQGTRSGNAGVSTTYPCSISSTNIRRIRVSGGVWASTDEHSIGEIVLAFKAKPSDLQAYGLL